MRHLLLAAVALLAASPSGAQQRRPSPTPRSVPEPTAEARAHRDSLARIAAALVVAARLDSARLHHDSAAAASALCPDAQSVPARGPALARDSVLRLVARGSLAYVFPTTPESAMLVLSPQDSTVLLTGRTTIRAGEPARGASGRFWITRELRRRPDGWCQRRGRVGG